MNDSEILQQFLQGCLPVTEAARIILARRTPGHPGWAASWADHLGLRWLRANDRAKLEVLIEEIEKAAAGLNPSAAKHTAAELAFLRRDLARLEANRVQVEEVLQKDRLWREHEAAKQREFQMLSTLLIDALDTSTCSAAGGNAALRDEALKSSPSLGQHFADVLRSSPYPKLSSRRQCCVHA